MKACIYVRVSTQKQNYSGLGQQAQRDICMNYIKNSGNEFVSATEAERVTGISRGGIQRCCVGRYKQAMGFIWKYKESYESDIL